MGRRLVQKMIKAVYNEVFDVGLPASGQEDDTRLVQNFHTNTPTPVAARQLLMDLQQAIDLAKIVAEYMSFASAWGFVPWNYESPDDWRSLTLRFWERWDWESHENRDVQVLVLGPDAAAVQMIGVGVIRDTAGVAVDRTSHIKQVWVREAGQWKLLVARNAFTDRERL